MHCYFVYAPERSRQAIKDRISEDFASSSHAVDDGVWIVGSKDATSADLCGKLKIGDDEPGIVVKATDYYGFANRAIWDKMNAWATMA